jgi:hypothetical protein
MSNQAEHQQPAPKKPRLVFTDLQRRTLQAIFKVSRALVSVRRLLQAPYHPTSIPVIRQFYSAAGLAARPGPIIIRGGNGGDGGSGDGGAQF